MTTLEDFITNRGGTNNFVVEFFISSDYLKLRIDANISLLDNIINYLSTNAHNHGFLYTMVYTQPYNIERLIYHPSLDVGYGRNLGKREKGVKR